MNKIEKAVNKARRYFNTNATYDYYFRLNSLKALYKNLKKYEHEILDALKKDLNKSKTEAYFTEYYLVMDEVKYAIRNFKKWMKPEKKSAGLLRFPGRVRIYKEPYGVTLIISPWNYPFLLCFSPLIGSVAAGNTCIIKPSEKTKYTSSIIEKIIEESFDEAHVQVLRLDHEERKDLLSYRYDYIFFTGSSSVGKKVLQEASHYLTPVTIEAGGKSPCIIDNTADIKRAAKRVLFGKLMNAGQTCIAPDYLLIKEDIKDEFLLTLIEYEKEMLSDKEYIQNNYPSIISKKALERLDRLIENENIFYQSLHADFKNQQYPLTIIDNPALDSPIMTEEIFGPVLPVISFKEESEVFDIIKSKEKPLALYLFTRNKKFRDKIIREISFGGGCINDTLNHIASLKDPFGGVGNSGMGRYHGKYTFDSFSNTKTIYDGSHSIEIKYKYHPYDKWIHKLL